jgi:L-fuconolactonase
MLSANDEHMNTVDSHQHYWQLSRFDYSWVPPANQALHQDRLPADLQPQMNMAGIERAVVVHAANTADEIPWLFSLSDQYPYIAGVVGYLDLAARDAPAMIDRFAQDPRFKGVRLHLPLAQDSRPQIDEALRALSRQNLSCDLLLSATHLEQAFELVTAHPDLVFVLDHFAGIHISAGDELAFASELQPFATRTNCVMKVSGYLTAAGEAPVPTLPRTLQPYLDVALDIFGPDRLMFGSDWPVCTQRGSYADAVTTLHILALALSPDEQAAIWGNTAARVYRLNQPT